MITGSDVVRHLKTYLPIFTDEFTSNLTVVSASVASGNIVAIEVTDHNLSVGNNLVISGGTLRNPLSSAVLDGSTVKFTTKYEHDFIKPSKLFDDQTLTLDGFGSVWDDTFDIIDVPNRMNFNVNLPTGETLAPAVNETQYVIEERGINGVHAVATTPTDDTFTVVLSDIPQLPIGPVDDLSIITGFRICQASDFKRAQAIYTKQTSPYLFVIMTDTDISKDSHTFNDGIASFTAQDTNLLRLINNFSTTVFIPTDDDLSGGDAKDLCQSTLFIALLKSLFGVNDFIDSPIKYSAVPAGSGPTEYNTAYYAHVYDWQVPSLITYEDGFLQQPDVAFRDIEQTLKLFADDYAEMTVNINLDEEEL